MKVLITGASGFVGRSFINLFKDSHEVWGIGRTKLKEPNYFSVDLSVGSFDLPIKPDVVIHCAARSSPWGTYDEFYKANVVATQNVIDFCKKNNVKKLIYISSSSVFYKYEDQFNINENTLISNDFVNDYAKTKYMGEELVRKQFKNHVILRPRAVYGQGDTVLFPRILIAAKKGKLPVIKGKEVIGDLIYIDNLCHYILKACEDNIQGDFNLTDGSPVIIHEFLSEILIKLGFSLKYIPISIEKAMFIATLIENTYKLLRLKKEPPITRFGVGVFAYSKTFDVTKAKNMLGLPKYTTKVGISKFINWQGDHI